MGEIRFFSEYPGFKITNKQILSNWISDTLHSESNKKIKNISLIFCDDEYLFDLNRSFLKHNRLTDIITFDISDNPNHIEADIFISIDRVRENSESEGTNFTTELNRVIIHGILHLAGYNDKKELEKQEMRRLENKWLNLLKTKVPRGTIQ